MTVDFIFYTESYGGNCKIPAELFPLWERCAENHLSRMTGGKSCKNADDERVKMCICEIAEFLYNQSRRDGIASENNDGYSVSYEKGDIKTQIHEIASVWLSGTDILYRGVECEG